MGDGDEELGTFTIAIVGFEGLTVESAGENSLGGGVGDMTGGREFFEMPRAES